jgi:START domain
MIALVAAVLAATAGPPLPSLIWEKVRETDGITVYRSKVPGTSVLAFKGDGRVDVPLLKVAHVIIDPARGPEWVDSLAESRVLREISELEFLEYDRFAMPFLVKDRDFVSRVTVEPHPATQDIVVRFVSVEDSAMPPTKRNVRGDLVYSVFRLRPEGEGATRVEAEILCDPKGSLPKWLVNLFQKSWPVKTLQALRRQAARDDVTPHPVLQRLWIQPLAPRP